jgi:hypothetical protein
VFLTCQHFPEKKSVTAPTYRKLDAAFKKTSRLKSSAKMSQQIKKSEQTCGFRVDFYFIAAKAAIFFLIIE